jgi:outer membrane protein TolC
MPRFGFWKFPHLTRSLWFAMALWAGSVSAADFSQAWQAVLQNESAAHSDTIAPADAKHSHQLFDQVAIAYLHAMLAQDNFKAAHAQIHAVVMQRNHIRRHFFNGKDLKVEYAQARGRLATLLAQWMAARDQSEQQHTLLKQRTYGQVSEVAGSAFTYIPPALSSQSLESQRIQQAIQPQQGTNRAEGVDLEALRLYNAVQKGDAQLAAYKTALLWSLEALEGISLAQDAADHPHAEMLEAMATVQQAQKDLFKARYDNLYQRIRLCTEIGMEPEAIAAHIDALLTGADKAP